MLITARAGGSSRGSSVSIPDTALQALSEQYHQAGHCGQTELAGVRRSHRRTPSLSGPVTVVPAVPPLMAALYSSDD